ncbi:MAG: sensor histidine kinase [Rhodothermales bacterium]
MMPRSQPFKNHWQGFALLVSFWTLVAFIFAAAGFYHRLMEGEVLPASTVVWWMLGMYLWIPATLIVVLLVRWFPIRRRSWYRTVPFHAIAAVWNSLLMAAMHTGLRFGWSTYVQGVDFNFLETLNRVFSGSLGVDCLLYLTILAGVHAFRFHNESHQRMLEAMDLKTKLAEVQLQALKMQLHPHFLFNAFHTVSMLIRQRREEEAINMVAGLGTLLRYVLDNAFEQKVAFRKELKLLNHYLDVERIRFRDRLKVDMNIAPEVYAAAVPNLLLQPLVENSIRHGIVPGSNEGKIDIVARREGNQLRVRIHDNGVGLPADWQSKKQTGIGLANTKLRLERLYPDSHHIDFSNAPEGGCLINIVIPFERLNYDRVHESVAGKVAVFEGKMLSEKK